MKTSIIFFIRYSDYSGNHLRIKVESEDMAYKKLISINRCIKELKADCITKRVVFDTYVRKTNRYGGQLLNRRM